MRTPIANTHPFTMDGRIFAHNGTIEGLDPLNERILELGAAGPVLGARTVNGSAAP